MTVTPCELAGHVMGAFQGITKKSWNLMAMAATGVLVLYVGFLVAANYLSQVELQKASIEQLRQDTHRRSMGLSYFFSERGNDLRDITQDRILSIFFENKALGMSMEYGLRASLIGIAQMFDRLMEDKKVGEDRIYDGIGFLDSRGLLVDRQFQEGDGWWPVKDWKQLLTPDGREPGIVSEVGPDGSRRALVSVPYFFKGKYEGQIVAKVSLQTIYKYLLKARKQGPYKRLSYIASPDGQPLLPTNLGLEVGFICSADLLKQQMGQVYRHRSTGPDGKEEDLLVSCAPVEGTPFTLVSIHTASEVLGKTSVWQLPLAMVALSLLFLGGALTAWRVNTRNLILRARLEEAATGKQGVEEKNRQLEREITERKRAEAALRESEERYRRFFEDDLSGAFIASPEGRILACNPAFAHIFGFASTEEAMNSNVSSLYQDADKRRLLLDRLKKEKRLHYYESEYRRADGKIIQTIENITGSFNTHGELVEIKGFVIDNTEHRKLEQQLRQAQKMEAIGTLAGGIAHDFNNILTAIMGYTEMAMYKTPDDNPIWRNLEQIFKAGSRARDLVKQILAFSRQSQQERRELQLSLIVKETLKLLRASLPATIEITQDISAPLAMVTADPTQMHQVLMNLCTNAAYAMRESGGTLDVSLIRVKYFSEYPFARPQVIPDGEYVVLTVSDTGCGMDRDVLDRIFEPFFTTKALGEGTGMGLAVVHGIIKGHGGEITVDSEPGHGTSFHIFLPASHGQVGGEDGVTIPSFPSCDNRKRILMVDDEEALLDLGKEILEFAGYEVITRSGGVEALETFRSKPESFDLVITDHTMPRMTGADLARELIHIRPDISIILCTGYSDTIDKEKAEAMGIREFLMKPFVYNELIEITQKLLNVEHTSENSAVVN